MVPDQINQEDSSDSQVHSSAGETYVGTSGIVCMSVYLIFLGIILFYSLAALWPAVGALSITSVDPNQGPATAKTEVTILGTGFTDGTQVFFGDIPSIKVLRESDTVLLATTPPWPKEGQAGLLTVQVVSPSGQKNSLTNAFQFRRDTSSSLNSNYRRSSRRAHTRDALLLLVRREPEFEDQLVVNVLVGALRRCRFGLAFFLDYPRWIRAIGSHSVDSRCIRGIGCFSRDVQSASIGETQEHSRISLHRCRKRKRSGIRYRTSQAQPIKTHYGTNHGRNGSQNDGIWV